MRKFSKLIASIAFVVVLVALAGIFHQPLIAWFSGKPMGSSEGKPVAVQAGPFSIKASLDPDPPRQKGNAIVLEVKDGSGKSVDDATVEVFFDMPAMGAMAEMKGGTKVSRESGGRYRAEFDLPMGSGTWTLETTVHALQGDASQDFTMTVGAVALTAVNGTASAMSATTAVMYPPPASDALRGAIDAYERTRAALATDNLESAVRNGKTLSEALRAAAASMTPEESDASEHARLAAASAENLTSAKSLHDARKGFADLNRDFVSVVGRDARLTQGWRLFECEMFEDHPRWMQRSATPENPYEGTKMPTCGAPMAWDVVTNAEAASRASSNAIDHYTCSMHPSVKEKDPGKCPICGMDLIPVTKAQEEQGVVTIDEARRQLIGVRTAPVTLAPMRVAFRAMGRVAYDETTLAEVNLKVRGWITKLYVNQIGQRVVRGQTLFDLYSPELYNAQKDFLLAEGASSSDGGEHVDGLAHAAKQRLRLLGVSDGQLEAIRKRGTPLESVAFAAPATGVVIEKNVVEGGSVDPTIRLYRIAALNEVWVEADVYEADLANVRVGQRADITLDYIQRSYEGKITFVFPSLDPKSRTGRVRVELANKDLELRPGMYANVALSADLGPRIQVPAAAVAYTGPRRLVFVDLGQGRLRPQEVHVGVESDGSYEVLDGLRPGELVVTSGVFLIAAEARISTAAKYWETTREAADAGPSR